MADDDIGLTYDELITGRRKKKYDENLEEDGKD